MALDWDDLVLSPLMGIFGEGDAIDQSTLPLFMPKGGVAFRLADAVFDAQYQHTYLDDREETVTTVRPLLGVRLALFLARPPQQNDGVLIPSAAKTYVVTDVQPDGHGHAKLFLMETAA